MLRFVALATLAVAAGCSGADQPSSTGGFETVTVPRPTVAQAVAVNNGSVVAAFHGSAAGVASEAPVVIVAPPNIDLPSGWPADMPLPAGAELWQSDTGLKLAGAEFDTAVLLLRGQSVEVASDSYRKLLAVKLLNSMTTKDETSSTGRRVVELSVSISPATVVRFSPSASPTDTLMVVLVG